MLRELERWLRVYAALACTSMSLVYSNHFRWLATTFNLLLGEETPSSSLQGTSMHGHTHTQSKINFLNKKKMELFIVALASF